VDYDWPLLVIFLIVVSLIVTFLEVLSAAFRIFRYSRRLSVWKEMPIPPRSSPR